MAMIKCPECGKNVSDTAKACPHCGYDLQGAKARRIIEKAKKEQEEREKNLKWYQKPVDMSKRRNIVIFGILAALIIGLLVYVWFYEIAPRIGKSYVEHVINNYSSY